MFHKVSLDEDVYVAMGLALSKWQGIETALYRIVHAVLNTESKFSSAVFYQIKSPQNKIGLADNLLKLNDANAHETLFKPTIKKAQKLCEIRNTIAHSELQYFDSVKLENGDKSIITHIFDPTFDQRKDIPSRIKPLTAKVLRQHADDFAKCAQDLDRIGREYFPSDKWLQEPFERIIRMLMALHPGKGFEALLPQLPASQE
jgi:hypothetical protein